MTVTLIVLFALYQVRAYTHGRQGDLEKRAQVLAESLQETVEPLWTKGARGSRRRLSNALAIENASTELLFMTHRDGLIS